VLFAFQGGQGVRSGSRGRYSGCCRCSESFSFSCGFGSGRAGLWRGLAVCGSDPVPEVRGEEWPIRAVIPILPVVFRGLPGVGFNKLPCGNGEDQKRAAYGVGWRGDTSPRNWSCTATWRLPAEFRTPRMPLSLRANPFPCFSRSPLVPTAH